MKTPEKPISRNVSRRSAIGSGLVIAAGTVLSKGLYAAGNDLLSKGPKLPIAFGLTEDHWANMVDQSFTVKGHTFDVSTTSIRPTKLVLVETFKNVVGGEDLGRPLTLKQFSTSLLFCGPKRNALESATYRMHHPWMGDFDLMLSLTQSKKYQQHNLYEAVINS